MSDPQYPAGSIGAALAAHLDSFALFPDQIGAIMERFLEDTPSMRGRLRDDLCGYPESMLAVTKLSVQASAVSYLEEHQPQAWMLPLLRGTSVTA